MSELQTTLEQQNELLKKALKVFADAVENDNGDVTYHWHYINSSDLFRAYTTMEQCK